MEHSQLIFPHLSHSTFHQCSFYSPWFDYSKIPLLSPSHNFFSSSFSSFFKSFLTKFSVVKSSTMVCSARPAGCSHRGDTGNEGTDLWWNCSNQIWNVGGEFWVESNKMNLWTKAENILAVLSKDAFLYNYCYSHGRWVGQ